jgi:hypothetical protein
MVGFPPVLAWGRGVFSFVFLKDVNSMTMDTIGDLLRKVSDGHETVFDLSEEADGGTRISIERRQLQPERIVIDEDLPLARDPARAHVFHDIAALGEYCNRWAIDKQSLALACYDSQIISVILDESLASGRETVTFQAKIHPLFAPWAAMLDRPQDVIDFSVFAQKYRRSIVKPDGREVALLFSQIKMSKTVEVFRGKGVKSLNGVMVHIEIGGVKQDNILELPEEIEIECPIFIGADPVRIILDVLVTDRDEEVVVYLTSPDLAEAKVKSFESFVAKLKEAAPCLLVGLGTVAHRPWVTIPQIPNLPR